ncbi:MAG TPA: holo-[acyl-carrier-protein] synthase [Candidatus Dadabacteria bacterium]|jgi:holo-[acyl-carrier protein] synthase|nr:holo-[acyl-carrier-protein] synthase [Candidatus Dadabacteria bacterium]
MIKGVGVDILDIDRFGKLYAKWGSRLLNRIFNDDEIPEASSQKKTIQSLSGKFAAKEAISKAYGTGIGSFISFKDIKILKGESGQPIACLKNNKLEKLHLSISHTDTYAVAFVTIEI